MTFEVAYVDEGDVDNLHVHPNQIKVSILCPERWKEELEALCEDLEVDGFVVLSVAIPSAGLETPGTTSGSEGVP